jgi:hypothetical protein
MNPEELKDILMTKFHYPPQGADIIIEKAAVFHPDVGSAFEAWLDDGEIPDLTCEGYSIPQLISDFDMNPVAAFLTMDWLFKSPDEAVTSLKRGYDRIVGK